MQTRGANPWSSSRRSCVFESLTNERCEEVWGEGKISASLHQTVPYNREVWDCGLQVSHPVLRSKPDAHRMYTQDQVVIHMVRM
jgi:hypothetical protein